VQAARELGRVPARRGVVGVGAYDEHDASLAGLLAW